MSKRLIFTITTGRSGSKYITQVLRANGVQAFHEPAPNFVEVMRDAQRDSRLARDFWKYYKLPHIESLKSHPNGHTYFESSHMFCKGFVEPLLDLGVIPDILILKRDNRAVALSLLRLETVPDITPLGLKWLLSPNDPHVYKLIPKKPWTPYQLCYWYTLETDRRARYYERYLSGLGAAILKIESKDLFEENPACLQNLSTFFQTEISLERQPELRTSAFMQNKRKDMKLSLSETMTEADFERMEQEVRASLIPLE
ncbi:hypothetical protein [Methylomagnum ishizawai]|uniref:hypothetical protein n=1 Tax=Methylomagnum ishizawai TaxID=1760988 RepID=UPI001C3267A2|nr:hypothetical protein [Methylomagnum ishizawai]BBL76595.1 hypothetical protein MishRS11D_36930 [Methylomagnum ishizawai]